MIEVSIYPIGTKVYVCVSKSVAQGEVKKVEINEFGHANYAIKLQHRKSSIWLTEDEMFTDFEEFVIQLRQKFNKIKENGK